MSEAYSFDYVNGQYRIYKETMYVATVHTESSASVIVAELNAINNQLAAAHARVEVLSNVMGNLAQALLDTTPATDAAPQARYVVIIDEGEPDVGLFTAFHVIDTETNTGLDWFNTEEEAQRRADELNNSD